MSNAKKFRVVVCAFRSDGDHTISTYKGNLTEAKARAMADKLNAREDNIADDVIRNYHAVQA